MIPAMLITLQLVAVNLTYSEAKVRADQNEAAMPEQLRMRLMSAQGQAIKSSFERCKIDGVPESFSVVLLVGPSGHATKTWRLGDSVFSKCVEHSLGKHFYLEGMEEDFFTSFEFNFNEATI